MIRSIDPCLHSTIMGTYAQQTISTDRLRVRPSPHACLPKTIYTRSSPFALSLCSIMNSQLSLDVLLGSHRHIGVNAHPSLRSELAFRSFRYAQLRRVGFCSMPGVHPHRFVPYCNHAYKANESI